MRTRFRRVLSIVAITAIATARRLVGWTGDPRGNCGGRPIFGHLP